MSIATRPSSAPAEPRDRTPAAPLTGPSHARATARVLLAVHLPLVAIIGGLLVVARAKGFGFGVFSRDPVTTLDGAYYVGWLSNLTAVAWLGGAFVAVFAAAGVLPRGHGWRGFLLQAGLLTGLLGADDLFLLHDGLLPQFVGAGEKLVMAAYAVAAAWIVVGHRALVRQTCRPLLALAAALLGASVVVDLAVVPVPEHWRHLAEDGTKLLGVASWSAVLVLASTRAARAVVAPMS